MWTVISAIIVNGVESPPNLTRHSADFAVTGAVVCHPATFLGYFVNSGKTKRWIYVFSGRGKQQVLILSHIHKHAYINRDDVSSHHLCDDTSSQHCVLHAVLWSHIRTLICASSLQNLVVPQDFHFPVSISVVRSWWPCIRWRMTGRFQEQGQCLLLA